MASFPTAIYPAPTFGTNLSDAKTHTVWRDEITAEVRAIEIELGTAPSAAFSTVGARLVAVEATAAAALPKAGGTLTGHALGITPTLAAHLTRKDYVDTTTVSLAGDTMTGTLAIASTATNVVMRVRDDTENPVIDFWNNAVSTRFGKIDANATRTIFSSDNDVVVQTGANETMRGASGFAMFGKTASGLATAGTEIAAGGSSVLGSIRSTTTAASIQNLYARHEGSANANGQNYAQFLTTSTVIGSITQVNTTGVAYNTTSDERLKTVLGELSDDDVATILRLIAPLVYEFDADPGNPHVGFIAQQLAATWPTFVDVGIVTVGQNEPGDEVEYVDVVDEVEIERPLLDSKGKPTGHTVTETVQHTRQEPVPGTGFVPWMVDLAKFVPLLVAGWQAHDRRLDDLEAAA